VMNVGIDFCDRITEIKILGSYLGE
jgi:hypothetical protein